MYFMSTETPPIAPRIPTTPIDPRVSEKRVRRATKIRWLFTPHPSEEANPPVDVPTDALRIIEKIDAVHLAKEESWRQLEHRLNDPLAQNDLQKEFGSLTGAKEHLQASVFDLVLRMREAREFTEKLLEEEQEPMRTTALAEFLQKLNVAYDELVQKKESMLEDQLEIARSHLASPRRQHFVTLDMIDVVEKSYRSNLERIEHIKFSLQSMDPTEAKTDAVARSLYELFKETIYKLMHIRELLLQLTEQADGSDGSSEEKQIILEIRQLEIKERALFVEAENLRIAHHITDPDIGLDKTVGFPTIDIAA